jgi:hypothetical protein
MPDCDHPNRRTADTVEEAVGGDDDFAVGKIREFRKSATRFGEPLEPTQDGLRPLLEPAGSSWILTKDVRDDVEELPPGGGREADSHCQASASSRSASARTSLRS